VILVNERFEEVGAVRFDAVLSAAEIDRVADLFGDDGQPGYRLDAARLAPIADILTSTGPVGAIAAQLLDNAAFAVRALLFDKSLKTNWALGWHQDRTIAVVERIEVTGFGLWSVKDGQLHVQPPQSVTDAMITLRVHIDRVDAGNAPLRVISGSHRLGRLSDVRVAQIVEAGTSLTCLAQPGDVWAYRTPTVHASAATNGSRRRVLQLDYAAAALPAGLNWAMQFR
jgi:hypothetical protein